MTTFGQTLLTSASVAAVLTAGAFATPAHAGDWNTGASALKGSYASRVKAVPAPAPIPEYEAKYYLGLHGTFTAASSGTISSDSVHLDTREISDTANFLHGGFTIGRYLTPSIRADISLDFRPVRGTASSSFGSSFFGETTEGSEAVFVDGFGNAQTVPTSDTHAYNRERSEITEYQYQTGMINIYKDFHNGSRFTPFLGAGVGAVLYTFKRKIGTASNCFQSANVRTNPFTGGTSSIPFTNPDGSPACSGNAPEVEPTSGGETENSWGLALAGTAGVAVDLTESLKFDMAYRALYTSGSIDIRQMTSLGGIANVKVEDRIDHELRVGLRWDIN